MRLKHGIPRPGRNALTGEIIDPAGLTGKGWTLRYSPEPYISADGRALTFARDTDLDPKDINKRTARTAAIIRDFSLGRPTGG